VRLGLCLTQASHRGGVKIARRKNFATTRASFVNHGQWLDFSMQTRIRRVKGFNHMLPSARGRDACDRKNGRIARLSARQRPAHPVCSAHQESKEEFILNNWRRCGDASRVCSLGPCIELDAIECSSHVLSQTEDAAWTMEKLTRQYI
jgi:hypothetical protein